MFLLLFWQRVPFADQRSKRLLLFTDDVPEWAGTRRPGLSATDYVRESILNPPVFISPEFEESGPTAMPSLNLTDAEVDALVAYLLASDTAP